MRISLGQCCWNVDHASHIVCFVKLSDVLSALCFQNVVKEASCWPMSSFERHSEAGRQSEATFSEVQHLKKKVCQLEAINADLKAKLAIALATRCRKESDDRDQSKSDQVQLCSVLLNVVSCVGVDGRVWGMLRLNLSVNLVGCEFRKNGYYYQLTNFSGG